MEIKFRAWNKERKEMNQVKALEFVAHQDGRLDFIDAGWKTLPKYFELMRYTGLKDKNGKEIYEGDIIEYDSVFCGTCGGKMHNKRIVEWSNEDCGFNLHSERYFNLKIIGNIYENPELIPCK